MKAIIAVLFAGVVVFVAGQYFGAWNVKFPMSDILGTYAKHKAEREGEDTPTGPDDGPTDYEKRQQDREAVQKRIERQGPIR